MRVVPPLIQQHAELVEADIGTVTTRLSLQSPDTLAKLDPMLSPFPGMDPFIENQEWEDFHLEFLAAIRASLSRRVRPRYVVRRVHGRQEP